MTIERIQSPSRERWNADAAGQHSAPARSRWNLGTDAAPLDRVVVSDQARQLSASAAGEQGSGLRLDFKKLRELAFPTPSSSPVPTDSGE